MVIFHDASGWKNEMEVFKSVKFLFNVLMIFFALQDGLDQASERTREC
jgi:hypothetical protein